MSRLTIRLPDDKHQRLRELARHRSMSINKLTEELATMSITEFDAETRFRALATRGSAEKASRCWIRWMWHSQAKVGSDPSHGPRIPTRPPRREETRNRTRRDAEAAGEGETG